MASIEHKSESSEKGSRIDWPVLAFFALAYLIAWGLILVFNWAASAAGVEDGITLMTMAESLELGAVADQLPVPGWFLYLLTRVQDFAFTIAGLIMTAVWCRHFYYSSLSLGLAAWHLQIPLQKIIDPQ